ncbi:MAG: hypothetical protein JRI68_20010 [Deltaproteobacteria bacterium]|nr:hypothetical protein [Deltaproteobacteria bacterium]
MVQGDVTDGLADRSSHTLADRVSVVALALATALLLVLIATFDYGRDQGIYAVVGREILDGGMPYRDAWDFKPPGIYIVYAAAHALSGGAPWGIRILEVAGAIATLWMLTQLSQRWWNQWQIGLWAGFVAVLVHAQLDFWHSAQPETFGGMLSVAGLWVGTDPRGKRHRWPLLVSGVLFGCAGLLKPPLAGGGAVLAVWFGWRALRAPPAPGTARRRWPRLLRPAGWVLLGGTLPFALTLLWFWARGALPAMQETFLDFVPHYTALGWTDLHLGQLLGKALLEWALAYSSVVTAGLALTVLLWRRIPAREGLSLVGGVLAVQLLGVALQGKFFPYHYGACWPLTALLAAVGWWHAWRLAVGRGRVAIALFCLVLTGAGALRTATRDVHGSFWRRSARRIRVHVLGAEDQPAADGLATVADVNAGANRRMAEELRQRVAPGDKVYVWGFEPVLYSLSERHPASRFIYNVPQRVSWSAEATRRELMDELRAAPPAAIVVVAHDALPMVTGDMTDSQSALSDFVELDHFIAQGYGKLKQIEDLALYVPRRAPVGGPGG